MKTHLHLKTSVFTSVAFTLQKPSTNCSKIWTLRQDHSAIKVLKPITWAERMCFRFELFSRHILFFAQITHHTYPFTTVYYYMQIIVIRQKGSLYAVLKDTHSQSKWGLPINLHYCYYWMRSNSNNSNNYHGQGLCHLPKLTLRQITHTNVTKKTKSNNGFFII